MPTLQNYDENGVLKPSTTTTTGGERLTSFDSFMQGLDQEYDQRKQSKPKPIQRKSSEIKRTTTAPPPRPPSPLTLDGPIQYLDKKVKKKSTPIKKKPKPKPKKKPVVLSSDDDDDDEEGGETDPSKMVYDEDEAW